MASREGTSDQNDPLEAALASFREAWYKGERPDPKTFCENHPECGSTLREKIENFLFVVSELDALAGPLDRSDGATNPGAGDRFGSYRLVEELGRGGQGVVYLAEDTRLRRKVALKILPASFFGDARRIERFEQEARIAARLGHRAICAIFESGEESGVPFIAMQFVKGQSLARRIERSRPLFEKGQPFYTALARADEPEEDRVGPPPPADSDGALRWTVHLMENATRAVHAAHEAGIIHRDLKPANIMVTPERLPVILDFGLAQDLDSGAATLTRTHDFFGTPAYMAPEQIEAGRKTTDARTDVYALGATLYESLTGRRPFQAVTHEELYRKILCEELSDPRRAEITLPTDLVAIIEKALAKEPDERYRSARDLADDLERFRRGRTVEARPAGPWLRLSRWRKRNPRVAGVLVAVCVVLVIAVIVTGLLLAKARTTLEETAQLADRMLIPYLENVAQEKNWPYDLEGVRGMDRWLAEAEPICNRREGERMEGLAPFRELVKKIRDRRKTAAGLHHRTVDAHREAWRATINAIADANANPLYRGLKISPQRGLVPLGPDPDSKLFEFVHVLTGKIPERDDKTGRLRVTEETGLVLVLLPGGIATMGTFLSVEEFAETVKDFLQPESRFPLQKVTLDPFFISKYEMTQAQWVRVTGINPSRMTPGMDGKKCYTLRNPVENVTWGDCDRVMARLGLRIPTDAQWEYAARGGTTTIWWTGNRPETLCGAANLTPRWAEQAEKKNVIDDGYQHHAPVGAFRPNPFGLHDVCGNVREWVRERRYPSFPTERDLIDGEGERKCTEPFPLLGHMVRGGGWDDSFMIARSALCGQQVGDSVSLYSLGLRPSMMVQNLASPSKRQWDTRDE